MPKHNKLLGQAGEELASVYLFNMGYTIVDLNWRTRFGEIDIIATKNLILYLLEVKTRSNISFGYPSEAITQKKLQRMKLTAQLYISRAQYKGECRLAVVEVIDSSCNLIEI